MRGVILVSDKQARLKPCLRCGYSLLRITGAKNCPECGLAVRISLGGNSALEWSNPRWQRVMALALCVLVLGLACGLLNFVLGWGLYWYFFSDHFRLDDVTFRLLNWLYRYAGEADAVVIGLALCLLAKDEGRRPDRSRAVRRIALGTGMLLSGLGLLKVLVGHRILIRLMRLRSVRFLVWGALRGPWVALVVSILACALAMEVARRGRSRFLRKVSQAPLWPAAAGMVVWLVNLDRIFRPLSSIILDAVFPLAMIGVLVVTIRVLLAGAQEAELNWVTDP